MATFYRKLATELRQSRHRRTEIFGEASDGFGEPAWDILLELYAGGADERPMLAGLLTALINAPRSTTNVYLKYLSDHGIITFEDGAVQLTQFGFERMTTFLDSEAVANAQRSS